MLRRYSSTYSEDGKIYNYRPIVRTWPTEADKYIRAIVQPGDTWHRLAWLIYGKHEYYVFLLEMNGLTSPVPPLAGSSYRFLKPEYIEVGE
jgi:hypothetical protein